MVEIHLGNKEAIKILRRLRQDKTPVLRGLCDKIEVAVFHGLEDKVDDAEKPCEPSKEFATELPTS